MTVANRDMDEHYLRLAIVASREAFSEGNFPYGATLVSGDGQTVHVSRNNQVSASDCTGHAEVVLVREVSQRYGASMFEGATVYASGEPCAMCSGALFWAGVARIVFAMPTATINEIGGPPYLLAPVRAVLAGASRAIEVDGPMLEQDAAAVLREFAALHL